MTQTQSKTPAWLAYLGAWITGLIFLAVEKQDQELRWHAAQSLTTFGAISILWPILWLIFTAIFWILGTILSTIMGLGITALWIYLMYTAYQGKRFRVPIAADIAEKYVINWFK
ncbi:MAG: DUF4870 domain-containing protein [Christensenellales bacterium]|jgi:uncharacterized membrane protein